MCCVGTAGVAVVPGRQHRAARTVLRLECADKMHLVASNPATCSSLCIKLWGAYLLRGRAHLRARGRRVHAARVRGCQAARLVAPAGRRGQRVSFGGGRRAAAVSRRAEAHGRPARRRRQTLQVQQRRQRAEARRGAGRAAGGGRGGHGRVW